MSMLVRDYNQTKTVVKVTWDHYRQNEDVDLASAAAITQAAMQMTKSFVNEFSNSFPEIEDAEGFWHKFLDDPKIRNNMRRDTDEYRATSQTSGREGYKWPCHVKLPDRLLNYGCLKTFLDIWNILQIYFTAMIFQQ